MASPKLIDSEHNGSFSWNGITVDVQIYRLEDSKWTLEIVDEDGTSIVWQREFNTDDEAFAEFLRSVDTKALKPSFKIRKSLIGAGCV